MKQFVKYAAAAVLSAFGLLTVFLSGSVIFGFFGIREMEGNYVMTVVMSNFVAGRLYLIAAAGLFAGKGWSLKTLAVSGVVLLAGFLALLVHIYSGGIYEHKVIPAMISRIALTLAFTAIVWWLNNRKTKSQPGIA
jgi:hypothetical protein